MRASTMLEKAKELAVILCFDVPVAKEAEALADEIGIKIFKGELLRLFATVPLFTNLLSLQPTSSTTCLISSPPTTQ